MTTASLALLALLALAPIVVAADQAPLIENTRVRVWDVPPGATAPTTAAARDVVTFIIRGDRANPQTEVLYRARNTVVPGPPTGARRIVIELQDAKVPPLANASGYPLAFPRPGSRKLLENDRVVVTYLADGALTSTTPQGTSATNEHQFGLTKFNARDRVHTEMLARGQASAMMVELK